MKLSAKTILLLACSSLLACVSDTPQKDNTDNRSTTDLYMMKGIQYMEKGRLDVAQQDLEKAVELDGKNAEAHNALGVLYERQNRLDEAEAQYKQALALDENMFAADNNYARLLCAQGKYDLAMPRFQRVLDSKVYQTPWLALTNVGLCYKSKGSTADAESYLRKALEANPNFAPALLELAKLSMEHGNDLSARAFLQRYESTIAPSPESLYLGLQTEIALGNNKDADAYRKRLQQLFPDSKEALRARTSRASK